MLRKASEAVPESNDPVPQKEELGSGQPTMDDVYRMMKGAFDRRDKKLNEISNKMEEQTELLEKRLTRLEHGARQSRLAMEVDGPADTKTRERREGAATTAAQSMRGDGFPARRVELGLNTNSTSFGVKAEPPALPCRDDVVVESGAAASESCLPSLEMRSSTAAGCLVATGEASKVKETNFNQPPLRLCSTEETDHLEANCKKTSISSASYDSINVFQERNLSATPYCRRVIDTKSRQNRTFDPGCSQGHLRACPFLRSWHALVCGEVIRAGAYGDKLQRFFGGESLALRNKAGFDTVPGMKSLAVEGGSRLHELEGGTEVTTSWRLEVIGS